MSKQVSAWRDWSSKSANDRSPSQREKSPARQAEIRPKLAPAALQREWAAKLKASGFEDIECGDDGMLCRSRAETGKVTSDEHVQTASYYQRAGAMLHHRRWPDARERRIWELHSDGMGMNEIARTVHAGNTLVHATINRLRVEMLKGPQGNKGKKSHTVPRNDHTWWRWLERQAKALSDADLMAMAPTLLQLAKSTPSHSSTR